MKVLWVTSEYYPRVGGLERYVEECLDILAGHCQVGLVTGPGQRLVPYQDVTHLASINLGAPESDAEFNADCCELIHLAAQFGADVVHFASAGLVCYARVVVGMWPGICYGPLQGFDTTVATASTR